MKRTPKQNGTEAETAVVSFLRECGFTGARREALAGKADTGDIGGIEDLAVQVKAVHKLALAQWIDEAATQADRKGVPTFVVVHKRWRRGNPGDWYVTLPLRVFAPLYAQLLRSGAPTR